jgi:hypothetical protein
MSFGAMVINMASTEQKRKLLKAKIAVALQDELGRVPKEEEINQVFLLTRVMYKAVLGLHFKRKEQKKQGQLAIFQRDDYAHRLCQGLNERTKP